jgi:DNA mismatch repair ATPase MutL
VCIGFTEERNGAESQELDKQNSREIRSNPTEHKANAKKNESANKKKSLKKHKKASGKSNKKNKNSNNDNKKSDKKKKNKSAKKSKGKKKAKSGQKKAKKGKETGKKVKKLIGTKQSGCLAANCLDLAVYYINLARVKVTNYQNQKARILRQKGTSQGKADKKANFANSLNQLITAGGGNMSSLSCGGKNTTNVGKYVILFFVKILSMQKIIFSAKIIFFIYDKSQVENRIFNPRIRTLLLRLIAGREKFLNLGRKIMNDS